MSILLSPNMNLPVPVVGQEAGPQYAQDVNNSLNIVDGHTHAPGSGVQINPNGININSALTFNNNFATNVAGVTFFAQSSQPSSNTIYQNNLDLFFVDGAGNNVRLTQNGTVAGATGSITGLVPPASASYVIATGTFVFQQNTNVAANIDAASYLLRNVSPNSTFALTLNPPANLGADYSITLPLLPGSASLLSIDNTGAIATNASQIVHQSNLALRSTGQTVGAGGVAIDQIASFTQTNATQNQYYTVATVTITTTGRPVMVQTQAYGNGTYSGFSGNFIFENATQGLVSFFNGAGVIGTTAIQIQNPADYAIPAGSFSCMDFPTAGTYTYTVQMQATTSTVLLLAAKNVALIAYEL